MKTVKRITSLAAVVAMLASAATLPVSAAHVNRYTVSYETLTEAIETNEGYEIPVGAVAVTMSVEGNMGFNNNTLIMDIDNGYTVLTDAAGEPVVEKGSVLSDALISTAANGNVVGVATAMENTTVQNGELFTVYFVADTNSIAKLSVEANFVQLARVEPGIARLSDVSSAVAVHPGTVGTNSVVYPDGIYFYGGDCDNNNIINAFDASLIMQEIERVPEKEFDANNYDTMEYFRSVIICKQPDANGDGKITHPTDPNVTPTAENSDAQTILKYAVYNGVGSEYTGYGCETVGQLIKAYSFS